MLEVVVPFDEGKKYEVTNEYAAENDFGGEGNPAEPRGGEHDPEDRFNLFDVIKVVPVVVDCVFFFLVVAVEGCEDRIL